MIAMNRMRSFRRAAIVVLSAALALGAPVLIGASNAWAQAQGKFRAIRIDVSALPAKGLGPEASWLEQDLPGPLRAAFAGRLAPGDASAPTLVVRIDGVIIGQSGDAGGPFGATAARDQMEGAGVVLAPNGRPVATYPMFTTLRADTGGSAREMNSVRGRVAELAASFAQWLPGQMGQ
jgi:hypothetical protein